MRSLSGAQTFWSQDLFTTFKMTENLKKPECVPFDFNIDIDTLERKTGCF